MTGTMKSLAHSRGECKDQVVVIPKLRRTVSYGALRQLVGEVLHEVARQKECRSIAGHLLPAPVHRCIEIPPKDAVAAVSGCLKGKRALALARRVPEQERHFTGEPLWARGDAVSTVGFELERVKKSIREQEKADKEGRF